MSRRHATFTRTADGTVVKDIGSLNGTYVNRDLVDECLLRHGDEVQIGKFRLVYYGSPQGCRAGLTRSMTPTAEPRRGRTRSIGQVLAALQRRVPRHLHLQDPLPRVRGADHARSGRRRATGATRRRDVERLRYVLSVQREHYLPLKVIREHLELIDRGVDPADARRAASPWPTAATAGPPTADGPAPPPPPKQPLRLSRAGAARGQRADRGGAGRAGTHPDRAAAARQRRTTVVTR